MKIVTPVRDDIAARGERVYQEKLRNVLEPQHNGEIAVIDVDTGEYELDKNHLTAIKRARARWPGRIFYSVRVGFPVVGHIGGGSRSRANKG